MNRLTNYLDVLTHRTEAAIAWHATECINLQSCCNIDAIADEAPRLVQMLRLAALAMDQARRESASEPHSLYARSATIILNAALASLDAQAKVRDGLGHLYTRSTARAELDNEHSNWEALAALRRERAVDNERTWVETWLRQQGGSGPFFADALAARRDQEKT